MKTTFLALAAFIAFLLMMMSEGRSQTAIAPGQITQSVQVIEWWKCTNKTATSDCTGIEYMRLRYADGTTQAFTLVPTDITPGPPKWAPQPIPY